MKPVKPINVFKDMTVKELTESFSHTGFNARRLGNACTIFKKMISDSECKVFLGLAGAMVPAGIKSVINTMIKKDMIDAIVTTGANITHDVFEAIGHQHYIGDSRVSDKELHKEKIDRIYDVFLKDEVYQDLEDFMHEFFQQLKKKKYNSCEFLFELGKFLDKEDSILSNCYKHDVKIFCPSLPDCGLGLQIWNYKKEYDIIIDVFDDWQGFVVNLVWDAKSTGCLLIGGGVPKNFILQAQQFSEKQHSYGIQITTDRPEPGGLSGAELREAVSWGKLGENSEIVDVICDATIALPILVASVL